MRTLERRRDVNRRSELALVLALLDDEAVMPGDIVMLEDVGAALVLSAGEADRSNPTLRPGERAALIRVEAFALDNAAPDIP